MAVKSKLTELEPYKLIGAHLTERQLGHGAYATVLEVNYKGLKCAGKRLHELLSKEEENTYSIRRFCEECHLLSRVRHPNIVQFLGVHYEPDIRKMPVLVMEYLPTDLASCLKERGILQKQLCYSILYDVALGLVYLHSQLPPIIHRDLSANNVLLTSNMTAKISDLGVARILNLTPLRISNMTQTPGTPAYMPPEVMVANPQYGTSVDIFSYGILMIHIFSGRWPEPETEQVRTEGGIMIPITEAGRRSTYLEAIGNDHPMMMLILQCIDNDFQKRPHAETILNDERFNDVRKQTFQPFQNQLDSLRQIVANKKELAKKDDELSKLHARTESQQVCIIQKQERISNLDAEVKEHEDCGISAEVERLGETIKQITQSHRNKMKILLADMESSSKKADEHVSILSETVTKKLPIQHSPPNNPANVLPLDALRSVTNQCTVNYCMASTFIAILLSSVITASLLRDILHKRASSASMDPLKQVHEKIMSMNISWKECADLPSELSRGQSTVVDGIVYVGGGVGGDASDEAVKYLVYRYDPSTDMWTTLPTLPVRYSSLGNSDGSLVAIGGINKTNNRETSEVYTYDNDSCWWKKIVPPLSTPRYSSGILSFRSVLVAVGGTRSASDMVEIFDTNKYEWYQTYHDPVPTKCYGMSTAVIGNIGYLLGGFRDLGKSMKRKQVFYTSLDDLLDRNSVKSPWKELPNTPNYHSAAAVLDGTLLAIGGEEKDSGGADKKEVYAYSPFNNSWIYICDLPAPRALTTVAVLSSTEILVIGGWNNYRVKSVFKGTLTVRDSSWYDYFSK